MKRVVIMLLFLCGIADAHVGSPDVFFDGEAGPYHVAVTVRMPDVIPGTADIEIRTDAPDATDVTVVPMRLTGPGSELPPTPDHAARSAADAQFFTATLWLMEHGSLQVRVAVDGPRGHGETSVPVPAAALRTLGMDRTLGGFLFAGMLLLALAIVSIVGAAVRESGLPARERPTPRARRIAAIAITTASLVVAGVLYGGSRWWDSEASEYEKQIAQPWNPPLVRDDCTLRFPPLRGRVMPDHGHIAHVFLIRRDGLDAIAHLHPDDADQVHLPRLPAGRYAAFVDIVWPTGFPQTGTQELDLPDLMHCPVPTGDDAAWIGARTDLVLSPPDARAGIAQALKVHAPSALEPYMGMAGHAIVVKDDLSVFAHLHPNGTVAMPALMLAHAPHEMFADTAQLPPDVSFPYGFPEPGAYHVFVQVKRAGRIETGAFAVDVR